MSSTSSAIALATYDLGADGHYICKSTHICAALPILHNSTKSVDITNGGIIQAKNDTCLLYNHLHSSATKADKFRDFLTLLVRMGYTGTDDTDNVPIFMKDGDMFNREQDVMVTCDK